MEKLNDDLLRRKLDQALEQIRCGQSNQGHEEWQRCFEQADDTLSGTDVLFLMADLADTLFDVGLIEAAKQWDQHILDELDRDESEHYLLVSANDRVNLRESIEKKYKDEIEGASSVHSGDMSNDQEVIAPPMAEHPTQVVFTPPLLRSPNSNTRPPDPDLALFSGVQIELPPSDKDDDRVQTSAAEVNTKTKVLKSDEARLESLSAPKEQKRPASRVQRSHDLPIEWNEAEVASCSGPRSQLLESNPATKNSSSWLRRFRNASERLKSLPKETRSGAQVGIAILDTGCDIDDPYFRSHGIDQEDALERNWFDFVEGSPRPSDQDMNKHGTALAILLLQLAPEAAIHVFRVARCSDALEQGREAIKKAIHLAAQRNVDIISMSFGFSDDIILIQEAILEAEKKKHNKILFFAAANNDGQNEPERFPAHFENVISVRGTDHVGEIIASYNPENWPHKPGDQFCTLAKDVPCGFVVKSGCSVATPILASIAATIIAFVEQQGSFTEIERDAIRTRRGITSVFQRMTGTQNSANGRLYVAPWQLLRNGDDPLPLIRYALSMLPKQS